MGSSQLLKSFQYAFKGLKYAFVNEQNFRLQVAVAFLVAAAAYFFRLRRYEWLVILLLVALVLILELINTALEKMVDLLKPRLSFQIEVVKDIMAAVVFCASFFAVLIGLVIFWPYLLELFKF